MLREKADVNKPKNTGATALYAAVFAKHHQVISVLLSNKASVNQAKQDGSSPLYVAIEFGSTRLLATLLEADHHPYVVA